MIVVSVLLSAPTPSAATCSVPEDLSRTDIATLAELQACTEALLFAAKAQGSPTAKLEAQERRLIDATADAEKNSEITLEDLTPSASWDSLVTAHVKGIEASVPDKTATIGDLEAPLRFTKEVAKSGSGQTGVVSEKIAEAFTLVADIAVKRARQQGLSMLKARLEDIVCALKLPTKLDAAQGSALPNTCQLIRGTTLERIAGDPRTVQVAIYQDFLTVVIAHAWRPLAPQIITDAKMQRLLDTAIAVASRVLSKRDLTVTTSDSLALVDMLIEARGIDKDMRMPWSTHVVPIGLSAASLYLSAANTEGRSLPNIINELISRVSAPPPHDPTTPAAKDIFADALKLANLVVIARTAVAGRKPDGKERLLAATDAIFLSLELHVEGRAQPAAATEVTKLKLVHKLIHAAVDRDMANTLAHGTELLSTYLPELTIAEPASDAKWSTWRDYHKQQRGDTAIENRVYRRRLAKMSALLTAVTAYAETYREETPDGEPVPAKPEEHQERRRAVLESLIDATTVRDQRHGEWVFSLGIPLGFAAGYQRIRERALDTEGEPILTSQGAPTIRWRDAAMYPQLEIPLGFGAQKLVGGRAAVGKRHRPGRTHADGLHLFASVIDLGQFLSFDETGKINRPRWDSFVSPGLQVGWMFGTPRNSFILGVEARYAPTLFAGTSKLTVQNKEDPGGAFRAGLFVAYYIPLFDFN